MSLTSLGLCAALAAACAADTKPKPPGPPIGPNPEDSLTEYTVSYRSQVRVPDNGRVMSHTEFAEQVASLDPISAKRCWVSNNAGFQMAADALGGITWTHPVQILKDLSRPPLFRGKVRVSQAAVPGAPTDGARSAAPTIERPDLVGYQESTAIFLSQRHGLLAVKTDSSQPVLSCALKLPGQAKYFFYKGDELVLLVNGLSVAEAALLRFRVTPNGFDFVDAVMLDRQRILDARLFDRTLIVYSTLLNPAPTPDPVAPPPTGSPAGDSAGAGAGVPAGARIAVPTMPGATSVGVTLTAVKWDAALAVDWHEDFLDDPSVSATPFAGQDPVMAAATLVPGDLVATARTFKPFISASDRYVVVSRDVSRTLFAGTRTQTYSYCSASHEGAAHTVRYCTPKYEQRPNPDYREPRPTQGDYSCNGRTLLDCIQEAAPTVSRYIYVRVGETCSSYTYHDYVCDQYTTQVVSYPTYQTERSTQLVVYRYGDGDFVKLDEKLHDLAAPPAGATTVDSLTFTAQPLEVAGAIDHKGDLQFQRGHFYVLTGQGERLHTLLLVGNSIAKLGTQAILRQRSGSSGTYSGAHSTLFSDDRMMVSRAYYDNARPQGISYWSDVTMLDLSAASFPRALNQLLMPGSSDQLILASGGVVGPGTVAFTSGNVSRNLQKVTLFDRDSAAELGNLLLGTEFNADLVSTWLGVADDQRIRLDDESQRLFLPYSGYHHAPQDPDVFNPTAHRLNITAIAGDLLTSETTFDLVEDIIRTVSTSSAPGAGSALAFGDSSVYAINQDAAGWSLNVVEEFATPIATYRFRDRGDLHARIDRVGTRCQISTFQGRANAFAGPRLAAGPKIACSESSWPMGIGPSVVFADSLTGWDIGADGQTITALAPAGVKERLTHVRNDMYCALDGSKEDGTPVPYLDAVPASVTCFPTTTGNTMGGGGAPTPAGG